MQISRTDVIMVRIYILSVLGCAYGARRLVLHGDDDLLAAYHTLAAEALCDAFRYLAGGVNTGVGTGSAERHRNHGSMVQALKTTVSTMQTTASAMQTTVSTMQTTASAMQTTVSTLQTTIYTMQSSASSGSGSVYVRWGRNSCPGNGSDLVYAGYVGGSWYGDQGGAANYVCLTPDPQWGYYEDNVNSGSRIFGTEYQLNNHADGGSHYFGKNMNEEDAPCAVCRSARPSVVMMPGRVDCYSGWTKEYNGYLMSGHNSHASASEFVCVDSRPEVAIGGHPNQDGRLLYLVEGLCGSLKCPPYVQGRELTCVVCTK